MPLQPICIPHKWSNRLLIPGEMWLKSQQEEIHVAFGSCKIFHLRLCVWSIIDTPVWNQFVSFTEQSNLHKLLVSHPKSHFPSSLPSSGLIVASALIDISQQKPDFKEKSQGLKNRKALFPAHQGTCVWDPARRSTRVPFSRHPPEAVVFQHAAGPGSEAFPETRRGPRRVEHLIREHDPAYLSWPLLLQSA